ncbi:MAG TPA: bifunctional ADP-heptose synthase, partial [Fimbriimonas sp.]|nr:bifunctional ADP-heptose synthase [Fimbriimonas sp.]
MKTFGPLLEKMRGTRVLVVGDLMLDEYVYGRATRISQEAPVMVIRQSSTRVVPGGAANVAANLRALGAITEIVGVVGDDQPGRQLKEALSNTGARVPGIVTDSLRPTTRKTRVLADSAHQVLRIDHEDLTPVSQRIQDELIEAVALRMDNADVLLISDYRKGTMTSELIAALIDRATAKQVPLVANAKPRGLEHYSGAALLSLNRPETAQASGLTEMMADATDLTTLVELSRSAAAQLGEQYGIGTVLVTLSEFGMCTRDFYIPPRRVEVFDEAGAGDTAIATVTLGLATAG